MLYVIAGDGTGNKQEIISSLDDLMAKTAEDKDAEFWFAIQPGDKDTTKYIVKWLTDKEVYFDSIGAKIAGANEQRDIEEPDDLAAFMQEYQADGVEFLTLFVSVDDEVEEDAALMAQVEAAVGADVTVRLLNGQMSKISFADPDAAEVEEETTGPAAGDDEDGPVEEATEFTEADLKKMTVPELTALAKGQGLDVRAIGKAKPALIAAIIERQENPEPGEEEEQALDAALDKDDDVPAPRRGRSTPKAATNGEADPSFDAWIRKILGAVGSALVDASRS